MEKKKLKYYPKLKELAKHLRKNSTLSEVLLWQAIKRKKLKGYDFHRQKPIGKYIVDFYCPELDLVIEIDGESHSLKEEKDKARQLELENMGLRVIRVLDRDIKNNLNGVLDYLMEWVDKNK